MRSVAAALALFAAAPAVAGSLSVPIDQSASIALPGRARDVMVGNPAIADVALVDSRNLVVLGRSYGVTNVLVFDRAGRAILNEQIVVGASDAGRLSVFRGARVDNYACSPRCERTPMPGEPGGPYDDFAKAYTGYGERAGGGEKDKKDEAAPAP